MLLKKVLSLILAGIMASTMTVPVLAAEQNTQEETGMEAEIMGASYAGISEPRITRSGEEAWDTSGQSVTWDCIYFGTYPQAEVVPLYAYNPVGLSILQEGDVIVDKNLYEQLTSESAIWTNNTIKIGNDKYQRIKKSDVTNSRTDSVYDYDWSKDTATYRYFKYQPIKWRVLSIDILDNGKTPTALIISDKILDDQLYNSSEILGWETSSIRKWLNNDFRNRAFSPSEISAVYTDRIVNDQYDISKGYTTTDNVYLLAKDDVYGPAAQRYGFAALLNTGDEAKRCYSTTYAKAMGADWSSYNSYNGITTWWLRSPGTADTSASYVHPGGAVSQNGAHVTFENGVRPALRLCLNVSGVWAKVGTVCSTDMPTPIDLSKKKQAISATAKSLVAGNTLAIGAKLTAGDGKLTYSSSNTSVVKVSSTGKLTGVKPGKATITIKAAETDMYQAASKKVTVSVKPKQVTLSSVTSPSRGKLLVKWRKATGVSGYQVRYATKSSMSGAKAVYVVGGSYYSKTLKLTKGRTYYVQVRAYKKVGTTKLFGAWSRKLSRRVKS